VAAVKPPFVAPAEAGATVVSSGDLVSLPPEIPASAGMTIKVG
jgi:hypothetical protein